MAFSAFLSIVFLQPTRHTTLNMIRSGFTEIGLTKYKFIFVSAIANLLEKDSTLRGENEQMSFIQ